MISLTVYVLKSLSIITCILLIYNPQTVICYTNCCELFLLWMCTSTNAHKSFLPALLEKIKCTKFICVCMHMQAIFFNREPIIYFASVYSCNYLNFYYLLLEVDKHVWINFWISRVVCMLYSLFISLQHYFSVLNC